MTEQRHGAYYLPDGVPQPAPTPDGMDAPYWEGTRRHELMVQHCEACDRFQWEPEWICGACQSFDIAWRPVPARGTIFAWERVWHPVHPALIEGVPYLVVLVELPEAGNVRMVGNLLGDPHQEVRTGAEVSAVFEDHDDDGYTLVQWELAEAS